MFLSGGSWKAPRQVLFEADDLCFQTARKPKHAERFEGCIERHPEFCKDGVMVVPIDESAKQSLPSTDEHGSVVTTADSVVGLPPGMLLPRPRCRRYEAR